MQTAAYNLPNDDRVVQQKGSKRVMLKNVQEAKFRSVLLADRAPDALSSAMVDVNFESFFTHILAHELMHGLGPHQITVEGRDTTRAKRIEGSVQRHRRGQGRCHRLVRAAVHDGSRQGNGALRRPAFR